MSHDSTYRVPKERQILTKESEFTNKARMRRSHAASALTLRAKAFLKRWDKERGK
jgi:hypothetical protein